MQKKIFYQSTYPNFFLAVTLNKQYFFLGLFKYVKHLNEKKYLQIQEHNMQYKVIL